MSSPLLSDSEKLFLKNLKKSKIEQKKEYEYVDFFPRIGAFLIDLVILAILFIPFFILSDFISNELYKDNKGWAHNELNKFQEANKELMKNKDYKYFVKEMNKLDSMLIDQSANLIRNSIKIYLYLFFQFFISAIFFIMFWLYQSATPGKKLFSHKILDEKTFKTPTNLQYFGRYIGYIISSIPFGFGFIWVAFDLKCQAWHDKLSSTVVVKIKKDYLDNFDQEGIDEVDNLLKTPASPRKNFKDNPDLKYAPPGFELESKEKVEQKHENKEILFLKEDIEAKNKKIQQLEGELIMKKHEIKTLDEQIKQDQVRFKNKTLRLFSIASRTIITNSELNQETINSLVKLSNKFNIETKDRNKILNQLVKKKKKGLL